MSTEFQSLLEQMRALQEQIKDAHDDAERRLIEAKARYREDKTEDNKAAKEAAVAEITEIRRMMRLERKRTEVGGDAYRVDRDGEPVEQQEG